MYNQTGGGGGYGAILQNYTWGEKGSHKSVKKVSRIFFSSVEKNVKKALAAKNVFIVQRLRKKKDKKTSVASM